MVHGKSSNATVVRPPPPLDTPTADWSPVAELFKCPFPIYVDASRRLYRLMGMTKMSNDFGPFALKDRAAYHQHAVPRQVVGAIGVSFSLSLPLIRHGCVLICRTGSRKRSSICRLRTRVP